MILIYNEPCDVTVWFMVFREEKELVELHVQSVILILPRASRADNTWFNLYHVVIFSGSLISLNGLEMPLWTASSLIGVMPAGASFLV